MGHLQLEEEEKILLIEVLESTLSDLSYEISNTDLYDYKTKLKERRELLRKIAEKIRAPA